MKRTIIILFSLVLCFNVKAQNWVPLDTGIHLHPNVSFPYGIMADNVHNNLFAFGAEYPSANFPGGFGGLTVWNNNIHKWEQWFSNMPWNSFGNEMTFFNNKVLYFYPYNDNSIPKSIILQFTSSNDLDTLKLLPNQDIHPSNACIYNGNLIVFNTSYSVTPQETINTFDGNIITPIGDTALSLIYDACVYKNELYCAGYMSNGMSGVAKLTNNGWKKIFQVYGGTCNIGDIMVYNNRLYVSGSWNETQVSANFGNNIVAYDGTNWDKLGGGVTSTFGPAYEQIMSMKVCKNKLFIVGKYTHAGSMPASKLLYWNDTTWCSIYKDLDSTGQLLKVEPLDDTLYVVADFFNIYGNSNYGIVAKLNNMDITDTCTTSFVSVGEINNQTNIMFYPNPTTSILNIVDENNQFQDATIQIKNNLGQLIFSSPFANQIDLSSLSAGMYFLTIDNIEKRRVIKIIKE